MNADSPLSNIDNDEVISDSENEGTRKGNQESINRPEQFPISNSVGMEIPDISFPLYDEVPPRIDYFAGFQGDIGPIPSIAERAKMRQRKTKAPPATNVLELTDDDELMLKSPPSKPKKKAKPQQKHQEKPPITPQTEERNAFMPPPNDFGTTPIINARPKVRPKPVKKPQQPIQPSAPRTSQATIPVPTSPFPPPRQKPTRNSSHSNLPPSDPPPTSSLPGNQDFGLPPIEFLPPAPIDSDLSPPSSLAGPHVDELGTPHQQDQLPNNDNSTIPPCPSTFFAGSSSLPPINPPSPAVLPPPPSVVDLTHIPSTAAGPSTTINNTKSGDKTKKPRKARKKRGESEVNDGIDEPQPTTNKKGKKKANLVTVEVPLPPPHLDNLRDSGPVAITHKGKQKQIHDEDELNISRDSSADGVDSIAGPPSSRKANPPPFEGKDSTIDDAEPSKLSSVPNKRKVRKRKEPLENDDVNPMAASPSKKKKTSNKAQDNNAEEELLATEERLKKGKRRDEGHVADVNQGPPLPRAKKGKGRMVIASDDEDEAQPNPEDIPSPIPPASRKRSKGDQPEFADGDKSDGREGSSQGNREVFKRVQPSDARNSSPGYRADMTAQQRQETPSAEKYPSLTSRYTIAPKKQTPSMSELIRRANTHPSSPFRVVTEAKSPIPGLAYSPYLKASRRTLSRIAPLHPNRKTPPPPLPPPPPKKKSKKELEMEEKWEEEIIEDIGGISEWLALSEEEKKSLKRMKRDKEMGYCED